MQKPEFTITCVATDRTRMFATGEVEVPGCTVKMKFGEPEAIFREALNRHTFEITEMSMSSHIVTTARGDAKYIAVPVFLSRAFRQSAIFVRADASISTLADLKTRNIGVPEYQQTAAMWVRGMMGDEGVRASDVIWHVGGLNAPSTGERIALKLPDEIKIKTLVGNDTLDEMLLTGRLDAVISPRVPGSVQRGDPRVQRLYPDLREAEIAYYRRTGYFPIMHALALRKDVARDNPWLPEALFYAFSTAKKLRQEEMAMTNVLRVSLPWSTHDFADAMQITDGNPWPYGFERNRAELAAMARYMHADGTASREVAPEELFHDSTLALAE
jgi:4,5-dihydroxyphthalate decarboxylase